MLIAYPLIVIFSMIAVVSCSKKANRTTSGQYIPAVLSADAESIAKLKPTRPNGGDVEGKGIPVAPEEVERRRNKNIAEPIIFGDSVAGVSMTTPYSEAHKILSLYGSSQGLDFFAEYLAIFWAGGSDPLPYFIRIDKGYGMPLKLAEPYGSVLPGQSMAQFFTSKESVKSFLVNVGAGIENQAAGYDCEKALTCQLAEDATSYIFQYRRGGIKIGKTADFPILFIYFIQPQKFYPRATDPIVYGISIGGATFQTRRTSLEARLGPPSPNVQNGFFFYDQESLAIQWGGLNTPTAMAAVGTYQGALQFGTNIGTHHIGDSFKAYAPANDDGTALMKALDLDLNRRAADFDCTTATGQDLCQFQTDTTNGLLFIQLGRNSFLFMNGAERTWVQYLVNAP